MAAPAAASVSREDFEAEFKVMFEFYRWWGRMSREEEQRTQELSAYYEKQGVQWTDRNGKLLPIPMWVVRRVVQWSECNFSKAKKICMFHNHPSGRGCLKKEGKECGYVHKCIFCESQCHGLYFCKPNGRYVCPKLKAWEKEVATFTQRYGQIDEEALKALAKQPRQQRRQPAAHSARRMNLFESIASSDSEVYELKTSESDEAEAGSTREVPAAPQCEAREMVEPPLAGVPGDSGYDSAKEPGDSDSDGHVVSSFNKQPALKEAPGLERRVPLAEVQEEGSRSVSDTGSTPIGMGLLAEESGLASYMEHKLRGKLGSKFRGDRKAFHSSLELVRYLQDNSYTDELRVYRNMVAWKNRTNHFSDGDAARPTEQWMQDGTWPTGLFITDLHRSGTRPEKLLLELLCLRARFAPGAVSRHADVSRIFAQRVQVEVRDVLSFRDGYWAIAFSSVEDVHKVMCDSSLLSDVVQDIQHYRAQPTKRDNTIWFFNFLMCKVSLGELQARMETYGQVLNVHPINYHSNELDIVMNGWVEFREHSSAQQLIDEVSKDRFFYNPTHREYTVLRLHGTMISIMRDLKGNAQGSADWLDASAPAAVPAGGNERQPGVQALTPPPPDTPAGGAEHQPGVQGLPPALPVGCGERQPGVLGLPPAPPVGCGERQPPVPGLPPAPPVAAVGCGERQPGVQGLPPAPPAPPVGCGERQPVPVLPPPPAPPPAAGGERQSGAQVVAPPPLPPQASGAGVQPVPVQAVPPPPLQLKPPTSAVGLPQPSPPVRELPAEQPPLPPPGPPANWVPPPPPPRREQQTPCTEQLPVADLLEQLEEKVEGIRQVLEKAKLIHLSSGHCYIEKLLDWVSENEAAEMEELVRYSQQITAFMDLKALPAERFHKALQQALQAEQAV